jgi:hypothetical protein
MDAGGLALAHYFGNPFAGGGERLYFNGSIAPDAPKHISGSIYPENAPFGSERAGKTAGQIRRALCRRGYSRKLHGKMKTEQQGAGDAADVDGHDWQIAPFEKFR